MKIQLCVVHPAGDPVVDVILIFRSKCTALLNRKHRRFGRIWVLASAHALHLTTYYHVPEYFV